MLVNDKKLAVFHQLSKQSIAVSLPELLMQLGSGFTERTVRRWLSEMVEEGLIVKLGQKRGTRYQAKNISAITTEDLSVFGSESIEVLKKVRRPLYERLPSVYNEEWFNQYQPNVTSYLPLSIRKQLLEAGNRSKNHEPAGTYARHIYNRLLIDLSFNSSRLEGNTYSLLDTQRLVLEGTSAEGKLDEEKIMILNHKEAIRYLIDNATGISANIQNICTLHYLLADGLVDAKHAGKVRDYGVRIGGSTYIPFENPQKLQVQLERICNKAALIDDPYEQSLFLLIYISYLQAFADVNKRTARLSANIPLIKNNLVPLSFNDIEKDDYSSALIAIYELQNTGPLVDLFLFSYLRTCQMYDSTIEALGFDEIRVRFRSQRRAIVRHIILSMLVGESLWSYVFAQTQEQVPENDQKAFIDDIHEDLKEIDQSRIAGLGISPDQLEEWRRRYKALEQH